MSDGSLRIERRTLVGSIALPVFVVIIAAAATLPFWGSSSEMKTSVTFLTLLALAQMWNLLAGYGGLMSVGQQAFIGIGAYALWYFADELGVNPFLAVPLAGLVAGLIALPTAGAVFRLRGGYFAVGTWVVAEAFMLLVINTDHLGGGSGVTIAAAGQVARETREMVTYWLALGVAAGSIALVYFLLRSRTGLALTAMRDDQTGAQSLGVDVLRSKLWIWLIAAFGCGVTGAVIYLDLLRIQPEAAFSVQWSALMIFTVVIGGVGTIEGPILGAIIFFALQQLLADYGTWYLILVGAIAALVVVWVRKGLWGFISRRWSLDLFPVRRRLVWDEAALAVEGEGGSVRGSGPGDTPDSEPAPEPGQE